MLCMAGYYKWIWGWAAGERIISWMSTRVTINIGFYFEQQHYAQLLGYIPRTEANNIPKLHYSQAELPPTSKPKQPKS
jgi:hypothetical protein